MTMARCCGSPPCSRLRSSSMRVASSLPLLALSADRRSMRMLLEPQSRNLPRRSSAHRPDAPPPARLRAGQTRPPRAKAAALSPPASPATEASIATEARSLGDTCHGRRGRCARAGPLKPCKPAGSAHACAAMRAEFVARKGAVRRRALERTHFSRFADYVGVDGRE